MASAWLGRVKSAWLSSVTRAVGVRQTLSLTACQDQDAAAHWHVVLHPPLTHKGASLVFMIKKKATKSKKNAFKCSYLCMQTNLNDFSREHIEGCHQYGMYKFRIPATCLH